MNGSFSPSTGLRSLRTRLEARLNHSPFPENPDIFLDRAMRDTGLKYFGDPLFVEGFYRLHRSLLEEDALTDTGKQLAGGLLEINLRNRLRIEDAFVQHPEIADEPVEAPVFILGFPRSGSTLLQRLLSMDTRFHHLTFAEGLMPAPPPGLTPEGNPLRAEQAKAAIDSLKNLSPELWKKHSTEPDQPEECYTLIRNTFLDITFGFMSDIPSYVSWYRQQDKSLLYREHKRQLQILQFKRPQKQWILKAPSHTQRWRALLTVYPDARIIFTHRDPCDVIPSVASLISTIRSAYTKTPLAPEDRHMQAFHNVQKLIMFLEQIREEAPSDQVFHMRYPDLEHTPLETLEQILAFTGRPCPEGTRKAFLSYLEQHPKHKHGAHQYSLEHSDLTYDMIRSTFAGYRKAFGFHTEEPLTHSAGS